MVNPGWSELGRLTRDELRVVAPGATLLLPAAAMEQHGPHLPLCTDTLIAEAITARVGAAAGETISICTAPVLSIGSSHHHLIFNALSLRSTTFRAVMTDVLESAVLAGFRRLFVLNAHGGNDDIIRLVARDLVLDADVAVAANSYWTLAKKLIGAMPEGAAVPGHAGVFETSLVMALAPDQVREDWMPRDRHHAQLMGGRGLFDGFVVRHGDWGRIGGYTDAPVDATAELGLRMLRAITLAVTDAVVKFHYFSDPLSVQ